jgi:hypothetical protein
MQISICNAFTVEPSTLVGGGSAVAAREENVF